jgi:hypothetical protein
MRWSFDKFVFAIAAVLVAGGMVCWLAFLLIDDLHHKMLLDLLLSFFR